MLAFGLGLLLTILFILIALSGIDEFNQQPLEVQRESNLFNFGISSAVGLTIIAALAMVAFGLFQIVTNFRSSIKGLIGFGVLIVIFLISYSTSSGDCNDETISEGACKFISGGLTTMLLLAGFAAFAFVAAEIRNLFK